MKTNPKKKIDLSSGKLILPQSDTLWSVLSEQDINNNYLNYLSY